MEEAGVTFLQLFTLSVPVKTQVHHLETERKEEEKQVGIWWWRWDARATDKAPRRQESTIKKWENWAATSNKEKERQTAEDEI